MKSKFKIMILLMFVLSILSVSAVSATDNVDIAVNDVDTSTIDQISVENNDSSLGLANGKDIAVNDGLSNNENDEGNFTELQAAVNEAISKGEVLNLTKNYKWQAGESIIGISVNGTLTINGNGKTINGLNNTRAFYIRNTGDLTIVNNLTIINCNATRGCAFRNEGNLTIYDSLSIANCNATRDYGGAICNEKGTISVFGSLSVRDCSSSSRGGAIFNENGAISVFGSLSVRDCSSSIGGAIFNKDNLIISDSGSISIVNCSSGSIGGAIGNDGNITVYGSLEIDDCNASSFGGAIGNAAVANITVYGSLEINNCKSNRGGAIDTAGNIFVFGSMSIVNCSSNKGGAISNSGNIFVSGSLTISDCSAIFSSGSAIYNEGTLNISNSNFINNNGVLDSGIYNTGNLTLSNSSFVNSNLYIESGNVTLSANTFDKGFNIINKGGIILSNIFLKVSDVKCNLDENFTIFAYLYDDNNNLINDTSLEIILTNNSFKPIINDELLCYEANSTATFGGNYDITGTANSKMIISEGKYEVPKFNSSLIVNDITIIVGDVANFNVTFIGDEKYLTGNLITVYVNGKNYTSYTDANGVASFTITDLTEGDHNFIATFDGDERYNPSQSDATIHVICLGTSLNINSTIIECYNDSYVNVYLTDELGNVLNNKPVFLVVNKTYYGTTDSLGHVCFNISDLNQGIYNAKVYFNGDAKYYACENSSVIYIKKLTELTTITEEIYISYGDIATFNALLEDNYGNPLVNKKVIITVDGKKYSTTSSVDGNIKISISGLNAGSFQVCCEFEEEDLYFGSNCTGNINVEKSATTLIAPEECINYGPFISFEVVLKNENNEPVSTKNVSIYINGKEYVATTDIMGIAQFNIYDLTPGTYIINGTFKGDNNYFSSGFIDTNITVDNVKGVLSAPSISSYYKESKDLTIKLWNSLGNTPIIDEVVTVKLYNSAGKCINTYDLKTDDDGIAKVPLNLAVGTYTAKISCSNYDTKSISTSVKFNKATATISSYSMTTTYASGKYLQIKVVNSKTNKAMAGVKLALKVYTGKKYKTVYLTTDANGIAKYDGSKLSIAKHKVIISSAESTKSMTASAKTVYLTVKKGITTVSAPAVTNKYKENAYFNVTVKNKASGKLISGLTLKIKVYTGKKYTTYTVKTNSKGVAQLNTKALAKGTHKVVISSGSSYYTVSESGNLIKIV